MTDIDEAREHVRFYAKARDKAEMAWINWTGNAWEKEKLRRAYTFVDKVLLGWERELEKRRARIGERVLKLVTRSA